MEKPIQDGNSSYLQIEMTSQFPTVDHIKLWFPTHNRGFWHKPWRRKLKYSDSKIAYYWFIYNSLLHICSLMEK